MSPHAPATVQYDDEPDQRQILTADQLRSLHSEELQIASVRTEPVMCDGNPIPHVDIGVHAASASKLVIALGLPLRGREIAWPSSFSAWSDSALRDLTRRVSAFIEGSSIRPGRTLFCPTRGAPAGAHLEDILRGRSCPGFDDYWTVAKLLWRYRFAASFLKKGRLLELACGTGFGAGLLLKNAGNVTSYLGLDPDPNSIRIAQSVNFDERARFRSAASGEVDEDSFDCIVSFETIARAADPEVFLEALKQRLKSDGRLIISVPCERWHGFHANRGHWSSWNYSRIKKLLEPHFAGVEFYAHARPDFTENAFATGRPQPLDSDADRSGHEGYLIILDGPLPATRRPRVVVQRRYARGDALQATPIIRALRNRHPDRMIVVSTDVTEIFMNNPDVDLLMATSSGYRPSNDDLVVHLDEAYEKRPHLHILDAYAEEAQEPVHDPRLRLFPDRLDFERAARLIERKVANWIHVKYVISVHLCMTPDRTWPSDHWIRFLNTVISGNDMAVLVVGAGSDMAVSDHPFILNCVNQADFLTTAALISLSDCLIGPDSSLLHVAGAMGTSSIGLYGMVLPELRVPYGAAQSAVRAPVQCAGCLMTLPPPVTNPRCKYGKSFCMESISPEMVLARLETLKAVMQERKWARRYDLMRRTRRASSPELTIACR